MADKILPIRQTTYSITPTEPRVLEELLHKIDFRRDKENGEGWTTLLSNLRGVDVYLTRGVQEGKPAIVRLTVRAGTGEYGIHPDYLDKFKAHLGGEGIQIEEIDGERSICDAPYDWSYQLHQTRLAGYPPL
ncbi:hypothetical protein HYX03_03270 [Candidatus Woesearchaeota archaeon]|nr:hypothetical protein [Candidatus Woesearchaeota archaeon]